MTKLILTRSDREGQVHKKATRLAWLRKQTCTLRVLCRALFSLEHSLDKGRRIGRIQGRSAQFL